MINTAAASSERGGALEIRKSLFSFSFGKHVLILKDPQQHLLTANLLTCGR
jgi:hypothetical protein